MFMFMLMIVLVAMADQGYKTKVNSETLCLQGLIIGFLCQGETVKIVYLHSSSETSSFTFSLFCYRKQYRSR